MAIVTLTTDWGQRDYFAGAVKGRLLSALPELAVVDITHLVEPHNIAQAAFVLRNAFREFPAGTVHIVSVNSTASTKNPHVAVLLEGHYFIGADNGLLSLISDKKPEKIIEIDIPQDSGYFVFPGRDLFVKAAVHLAKGHAVEELGFTTAQLKETALWQASIDHDQLTGNDCISGKVIYVDNYGNCVTNIPQKEFNALRKNRSFYIHMPSDSFRQYSLYEAYDDVDEGKLLALMSTTGYLQIAINQGRANRLLGLEPWESTITVEFIE